MSNERAQTNERGQILILTIVGMTMLLGVTGLALDAGYMYSERNRLSAAADSAAKSAAIELHTAATSNLQAFANYEAAVQGFDPSTPGTTVTVYSPPHDGSFTGSAGYVEVIVSRRTNTFFSHVLGWMSLVPGAMAVAGYSSGPNCIVVFGDLSIGNSSITQPGCGVAVGGTLSGGGGHSSITANGIGAGSWNGGGAMSPTPVTPIPVPSDPLAALATPPIPSTGCVPASGGSITPGCYTNVNANGMTFAAGLYVITGTLSLGNNNSLDASAGVTLYFGPSASVSFGQHDSVTITAPTTGTYRGIALFWDRSNTNPITMNNNSDLIITGALYAKNAALTVGNSIGNTTGNCSEIVVGSIDFGNGNGQFANACTSFLGSPIQSITMAE